MPTTIEQYTDEAADLAQRLAEMGDAPDFNPEHPDFKRMGSRLQEIEVQVNGLNKIAEHRARVDALRSMVGRTPATPNADINGDIGAVLVRSEKWKNYVRSGGGGNHRLMEVPLNLRAPLTTTDFPSIPSRVVAPAPNRQNPVLALLNREQVSSGTVEVVYYPSAAPLAAVVAEGALKPEAVLTITVQSHGLQTLAHTKFASRQLLEDEARMQDFIGSNLIRGVTDKAEQLASAAIQAGTYTPSPGVDLIAGIRGAIANVQDAGFTPNGILINPLDAASADVAVWQNGTAAPSANGTLWGVPVVPTSSVPAGSGAYVGDFSVAVDFYYRGAAELFVTDSDVLDDGSSAFRKNLISFLAEMRCFSAVVRPEAISKATGVAATATGTGTGERQQLEQQRTQTQDQRTQDQRTQEQRTQQGKK